MKDPRTKIIPFILLGLACLAMLSVYIFLGVMTERAHARVSALQAEVLMQEAREARAHDTGRFLDDIRDDGELVYSFFVSRDNVVGAIETLESLSGVTGARVTINQVDAIGQTADVPGTLLIGLSGTGSWKQISQLLALLETLPFHSKVVYTTLATSPSSEGSATWTMQVRLEAQLVQ